MIVGIFRYNAQQSSSFLSLIVSFSLIFPFTGVDREIFVYLYVIILQDMLYLCTLTTLKGLLEALYNTLSWSVLTFLGSVGWSEGCAALFEQPQYPYHAQEGGECVTYSHQWWFPIVGAGMWASTVQIHSVLSEMPPSNMFSFWVLWTVYCKLS